MKFIRTFLILHVVFFFEDLSQSFVLSLVSKGLTEYPSVVCNIDERPDALGLIPNILNLNFEKLLFGKSIIMTLVTL